MVKLSRAIIKKYGISKKAWAVARGQRATSSKKIKTYSGGKYKMAKRRYKAKNRAKSKSGFGSIIKIVIGAGVAAVYEVFVSPMIPLSRNVKNILELAIGVLLMSMKRLPMAVRAGGAALATINAFEIIVPLLSRGKASVSSGGGLASFLQN